MILGTHKDDGYTHKGMRPQLKLINLPILLAFACTLLQCSGFSVILARKQTFLGTILVRPN